VGNVWIRIRHKNTDSMIRYDDVAKSKLFETISRIHGSNDIELRRKLSDEYDSSIKVLLTNYPHIDYDSDTFSVLDKKPERCSFDAYVAFKDVLVGREFDLD
jgi:hypothetical protein